MADTLRILSAKLHEGEIERPYVTALVDEVQDMSAPQLKFLRALVEEWPNNEFLTGDSISASMGSRSA